MKIHSDIVFVNDSISKGQLSKQWEENVPSIILAQSIVIHVEKCYLYLKFPPIDNISFSFRFRLG